MNRKKATGEIVELFIRITNKYNSLEKIPVQHGRTQNLYHSERHMLDTIGDNPGMNITELAAAMGVTKGAISQVVKKLKDKGFIRRYKQKGNNKEVFIELTKSGGDFYREHKRINEETIRPLYQELGKHSDDKVKFLIEIFHWMDDFLDVSRERMKRHAKNSC